MILSDRGRLALADLNIAGTVLPAATAARGPSRGAILLYKIIAAR